MVVKFVSGGVTRPQGFQAGGIAAGIKASGAPDLAILVSDRPATSAGVFTTHAMPAASVIVNKQRIGGPMRGIIVNSGNANAATGAQGTADAIEMSRLLAGRLGVPEADVLVCSTGVIGVPMPMDRVRAAAPLIDLAGGGAAFAQAIMTTDTVAKEVAVELEIDGRQITIGGCCKGAGMIHPNMATMLAFITTDASIDAVALHDYLRRAVDRSFNMIDVDGDMSTNDSVLVLANGAAGGSPLTGDAAEAFGEALAAVCEELAKKICRDAEGATTLIELLVEQAATVQDARTIARAVVSSLLLKTAIHGHDPNWGRILVPAGQCGVPLHPERIMVMVGDETVFSGSPQPFDRNAAVAHLAGDTVLLRISLGDGNASARAWGCNLSEAYVTLNSVYTT